MNKRQKKKTQKELGFLYAGAWLPPDLHNLLTVAAVSNGRNAGFDLIVSNPPYVPAGLWAVLDRSVREHEPGAALVAGPDGMDCIRPMLKQAPAFLSPAGLLAVEIDPAVARAVRAQLPEATIEQDWQGLDRYLFWTRAAVEKEAPCR